MVETHDDDNTRNAMYSEYRRDLLGRQLSNAVQHDKAILSLSTGALGLSIGFIKDIVPLKEALAIRLLILSWSLFGAAIIGTVVSYPIGQKAINVQLKYAEKYYIEKKNEYFKRRNPWSVAIMYIGMVSSVAFVIAVILTVIFVSLNL